MATDKAYEIIPVHSDRSLRFSRKTLEAIFGQSSTHYLVKKQDERVFFCPLSPQTLQEAEEQSTSSGE